MKSKHRFICVAILLGVMITIINGRTIVKFIKCRQAVSILKQMKSDESQSPSVVRFVENNLVSLKKTYRYSPLIVEAWKTRSLEHPSIIFVGVGWLEKDIIPSEIFIRFGENVSSVFSFPVYPEKTGLGKYGFDLSYFCERFVTDINLLSEIKKSDTEYISPEYLTEDVYVLLLCKNGEHSGWVRCSEIIRQSETGSDTDIEKPKD